ncbi:hypothetical protein [Profundibacterium mesophilum]|uniref:Uncharacterized protein n=1 Tax=Profundibacterium mesophilum KAUST100406-0324 TaxID=1037889 RepID=A0A921NWV1_9RHOB|nr:hypothetical protein [Profundibacterium mesophilum]KAF0676224.1 hypothetical protein PMES_01381 [Profundibacterium mesophilum KAUST100406-0324]
MTVWTAEQDRALMRWHRVGLGNTRAGDPPRSRDEIAARLDVLTRSGARLAHARAQVATGRAELSSGRASGFEWEIVTDEIAYWRAEVEACAPPRRWPRITLPSSLFRRLTFSTMR